MAQRTRARTSARNRRAHDANQPLRHRSPQFEPLEGRQLLAVVTVTTALDTVDFSDGKTSLREAIFATNLVDGPDTIRFDFGHDGPETIVLTQGELVITDDLAIEGSGANLLTIRGAYRRIFNIDDGNESSLADVVISDVTLTDGYARRSITESVANGGAILTHENLIIVDSLITGNRAIGKGGGIYSLSGSLRIARCNIADNIAEYDGGGIYSSANVLEIANCIISGNSTNERGGAIAAWNCTTSISQSIVAENSAFDGGAGLFCAYGSMNVDSSTISRNSVTYGDGGGIRAFSGIVAISECTIEGNDARYGGGIRSREGELQVKNCTISGNRGGDGGGIWINGGVAEITNSNLRENTASASGGGISNNYATLTIANCDISFNEADDGGGISNLGDITLTSSTVQHNVATRSSSLSGGGGIWNRSNSVTIRNSDISDNSSASHGGAIYTFDGNVSIEQSTLSNNSAATEGGAVYGYGAYLTLADSTVSGNTAGGNGGGVYSHKGQVARFERCTITNNRAAGIGGGIDLRDGHLEIDHTIVAANAAPTAPDLHRNSILHFDVNSSLIGDARGVELREAPVSSPDARGNIIGGPVYGVIDPRLAPLADNGGPTKTHALLPDSPAINRGDLSLVAGVEGVPRYDQRGERYSRVFDRHGEYRGRIDIGAFEYQEFSDLNLVVDTLVDELDTDYGSGDLSLREAIRLANNNRNLVQGPSASGDTIRFEPSLAGGKIQLTSGELVINSVMAIEGPGADLLTIDASGSDPTPDSKSGDGDRAFRTIGGPSTVISLSGLTITGGDTSDGGAILASSRLTLDGVVLAENAATNRGGAIQVLSGPLFVFNSAIRDNAASRGGGIYTGLSELVVENSTLSTNVASIQGGAIDSSGALSVVNSLIATNASEGNGGGIAATQIRPRGTVVGQPSGGTLNALAPNVHIRRSTIRENSALDDGGGLYFSGRIVTISDSTISGNFASNNGGGIARYSPPAEGIEVLTVNSTISGNRANGNGGGVFVSGDSRTVAVTHTTLTRNSANDDRTSGGAGGGIFLAAGTVQINHSIIADNADQTGFAPDLTGYLGAAYNPRYSLIGSNAGSGLSPAPVDSPNANGNIIGTASRPIDPLLAPLADNGGPTMTHALLPGSPAIDAGDPIAAAGEDGVPTSDQRGAPFPRVFGGRIDIGAVETIPRGFLAGDFSRDGIVDAMDYTHWRNQLGSTVPPGDGADGNGDGVVDPLDYAVWKQNFGLTQADLGAWQTVSPRRSLAMQPSSSTDARTELPQTLLNQVSTPTSWRDIRQKIDGAESVRRDKEFATPEPGFSAANLIDAALDRWDIDRRSLREESDWPTSTKLPPSESKALALADEWCDAPFDHAAAERAFALLGKRD